MPGPRRPKAGHDEFERQSLSRKFPIQFSNSVVARRRHCERERSNPSIRAKKRMDCFVAEPVIGRIRATRSLRAMTALHRSALSRRRAPEAVQEISAPQKNRGRRESRVPAAPAASRAK